MPCFAMALTAIDPCPYPCQPYGMALFHCNTCRRVYKDYMPIDDTCRKCGSGTVRLVKLPERPDRERLKEKAFRFVLRKAYPRANM